MTEATWTPMEGMATERSVLAESAARGRDLGSHKLALVDLICLCLGDQKHEHAEQQPALHEHGPFVRFRTLLKLAGIQNF